MGSKQPPPTLLVQQQIRENASDVQNFLSDLSTWSREMKAQEIAASTTPLTPVEALPLRTTTLKQDVDVKEEDKSQRNAGCDYAEWEKFDAEKACDEVDGKVRKKVDTPEEATKRRAIEIRLHRMAQEHKDSGNKCLKESQFEKAVEHYTEGIRCDKKNAILYANRAQANLHLKRYGKAIDDCTASISIDPRYTKSYFRRATARFHVGKLVDAKNDLAQILEDLEPTNVEAKKLLNEIHKKTMQSLLTPTMNTPPLKVEQPLPSSPSSRLPPLLQAQRQQHRMSPLSRFPPEMAQLFNNPLLSSAILDDDDGDDLKEEVEDLRKYPINITPIHKPPSRRSKRPLLPIHVRVIDKDKEENRNNNGEKRLRLEERSDSVNSLESLATPTTPGSSLTSPMSSSSSLPTIFSQLQMMTTIPSKPTTAAQFFHDWRKLKRDSDFAAKYIKQMVKEDYLIFGASLEYGCLSEILELLVWEFLPRNWEVLSHLEGLASVRRFSTLKLFLSEKDRANVRKLISECDPSIQDVLLEKYSVSSS